MAPPIGFEPMTLSLTARCSTAELQGSVECFKQNRPNIRKLNFLFNIFFTSALFCFVLESVPKQNFMDNDAEKWLGDRVSDVEDQDDLAVFRNGAQVNDRDFCDLLTQAEDDYPGFADLSDLADSLELSDQLGLNEWVAKFTEMAFVTFVVAYNSIKIGLAVKAAVWLCDGTNMKKIAVGTITALTAASLSTSLQVLAVYLYRKRQKHLKSSQEL